MMTIVFDKPVYSDPELTTEVTTELIVRSSTQLPKLQLIDGSLSSITVYYGESTYRATGKNDLGDKLYHVDFTYPGGVTNNLITTGTWDA